MCQQRVGEKWTGSGNTSVVELTKLAYGVDIGWSLGIVRCRFLRSLFPIQFTFNMPNVLSHFDHGSIDPFIISLSVLSCIHFLSLKLGSVVHYFCHSYEHLKPLTSVFSHCTCLAKCSQNCPYFMNFDWTLEIWHNGQKWCPPTLPSLKKARPDPCPSGICPKLSQWIFFSYGSGAFQAAVLC